MSRRLSAQSRCEGVVLCPGHTNPQREEPRPLPNGSPRGQANRNQRGGTAYDARASRRGLTGYPVQASRYHPLPDRQRQRLTGRVVFGLDTDGERAIGVSIIAGGQRAACYLPAPNGGGKPMVRTRSSSSFTRLPLAAATLALATCDGGRSLSLDELGAETRAALCNLQVQCDEMPDQATCLASIGQIVDDTLKVD